MGAPLPKSRHPRKRRRDRARDARPAGAWPWRDRGGRARRADGRISRGDAECRRRTDDPQLHAKAKEAPGFRFYALYDKRYRADVLVHAYARCRANGGAEGVDGQRFEDIEAYGVERWLGELAQAPKEKRYRADRNALTAVREVHGLLNTGHREVVDADLSAYFDSIPHAELLKSVARRVCDRHVLHLIKMWLIAAVKEDDGKDGKKRTTGNRDSKRGIPQGLPISPLLSRTYLKIAKHDWCA